MLAVGSSLAFRSEEPVLRSSPTRVPSSASQPLRVSTAPVHRARAQASLTRTVLGQCGTGNRHDFGRSAVGGVGSDLLSDSRLATDEHWLDRAISRLFLRRIMVRQAPTSSLKSRLQFRAGWLACATQRIMPVMRLHRAPAGISLQRRPIGEPSSQGCEDNNRRLRRHSTRMDQVSLPTAVRACEFGATWSWSLTTPLLFDMPTARAELTAS